MRYISTRGGEAVSASQAILSGLAPDGGLYLPSEIPTLSSDELATIKTARYADAARLICGKYLDDFTAEEISDCVAGAYESGSFDAEDVINLVKLNSGPVVMELFRGPTSAFKDMALQLMPRLLVCAARHCGETSRIAIVVATSGDTGKAALEGFCDVPGTTVTVVYPHEGVSEMQRLQMATQKGQNTRVVALRGNFDDAQSAVKAFFANNEVRERLTKKGVRLSSANSINWGRLLPQIVYYAVSSCRLSSDGKPVDFAVPTGNFGNILAAHYAREMGAPVGRLLCATNSNDVLYDFITTGTYDKNREFHRTLSPSMDILVSSNLERLLFELSGRDDAAVREYMSELGRCGRYTVPKALFDRLRDGFCTSRCDDERTLEIIKRLWVEDHYLCDPHTAAAFAGLQNCVDEMGTDGRTVVVASTASPYKFPRAVCTAIEGDAAAKADEHMLLTRLEDLSGIPIPMPLRGLFDLTVRHNTVCSLDELPSVLESCV